MTAEQSKLEQQLARLHHQYMERLQADIPVLASEVGTLVTLSVQSDWRSVVLPLKHKFHTLAGSAGTFGLPQLGKLAKKLELQLKDWMAAEFPPELSEINSFMAIFQQVQYAHQSGHQVMSLTSARLDLIHDQQALIYVLEDDEETAQHLTLTLATFGYQIQSYRRIAELDLALKTKLPEALILDITLPDEEQTGLDYIAEFQQSLDEALPVLVLTSHDSFEHHLQAVRIGAQGYFVKPLNTTALEARLQRLLAVRRREAFRVLIVDDDQLLAEHYALVLQGAGLRAEILLDPSQIYDGLSRFRPDVILLDVLMPGCSGPELAQLIRLQDEWLSVPIIYLSSETDGERQLAALVKGGDDFLTKPITDTALIVAVFARAQRARQLADMMTKDSLTGLLQHARVKERLSHELQRSERTGEPLSVVMLDIDHFKKVNDNYGHLTGDQVISSLANLLKQQLRKTDIIGRYGGEEFLLILPDCNQQQAFGLVEQLRQSFASLPFSFDYQTFHCTFSAGICQATVTDQTDQLIDQADKALYASKHAGRNQTQLYQAPA
ncbi:MAG: diguanylate cyclase [Gammaproteobacteria bacterium]|nr:diguanylate cyclase [Gammaproteobacteria bacterium]MBU2059834.1 diguanylate cyclase [Gammaproteobacteria bacterium]MBU2175385.1 diguanylate cyclase [Gammaproteobacteria bacterium]MBU2245707.1 diguanylate cyclase [Gammaproteobacteria bacterium]MBU2345111.1 diguanylate cyclase [Gammaproteobacteria bacterium]